MSFESNIPKHLEDLEKQRGEWKNTLHDLYHECECVYCELVGKIPDDKYDEEQRCYREIKEIERVMAQVKRHARLHQIQLAA